MTTIFVLLLIVGLVVLISAIALIRDFIGNKAFVFVYLIVFVAFVVGGVLYLL